MIFCPFLGMKTTDDMGKYIRKQRPNSNHTYLGLERMFSLATTLSILFFQEIKQDTRGWINCHASAKSGKMRQAGYDTFSAFQTNQGAQSFPGNIERFCGPQLSGKARQFIRNVQRITNHTNFL